MQLPRKAKQFLIAAVKLLIVAAAFYFIWTRLRDEQALWDRASIGMIPLWAWIALFNLAFLNRFFEILKWQNLVSSFKQISIADSSRQVLGALTVSIFTPNGIGEYGAKALFFEKSRAKRIVFLNLLCNGIQLVLTVVFGTFGLLYFNAVYDVISTNAVIYLFLIFVVSMAVLISVRKISIGKYSFSTAIRKLKEISQDIHRRNVYLAIGRYLFFSHQYYILFVVFGVEIPYLLLMAAITSTYFLASALPTFQFLDFAVKGGVAVYFFGLMGINEWIPVLVTALMWLLNVVLPVAIGSYYVVTFKSRWKHS